MSALSLSTRFDQRNLANTAYVETFVSGSNLVYGTNDSAYAVFAKLRWSNLVDNDVAGIYLLINIEYLYLITLYL